MISPWRSVAALLMLSLIPWMQDQLETAQVYRSAQAFKALGAFSMHNPSLFWIQYIHTFFFVVFALVILLTPSFSMCFLHFHEFRCSLVVLPESFKLLFIFVHILLLCKVIAPKYPACFVTLVWSQIKEKIDKYINAWEQGPNVRYFQMRWDMRLYNE